LPGRQALGAAEEAIAALGPDAQAVGVARRCLAKLLAPALPFAQRIALGFDSLDAPFQGPRPSGSSRSPSP
jgi:hypothetical protein